MCGFDQLGVSFHFYFISGGMYVTNNTPCILFILGKHLYCVCYFPKVKSKAAGETFHTAAPKILNVISLDLFLQTARVTGRRATG